MVGGLIHQQHVRTAEQHARQRHPHLPATGHGADIAVNLVVLESQTVQHLASLGLERVAAQMLVFFLHVAKARQNAVHLVSARGVFHGMLQGFQLMVQIADASAAGNGLVKH